MTFFKKGLSLFLLAIFSLTFFFSTTYAEEKNQFITIVNPVRISTYTPNSKESIETQYGIVSELDLPATWLLTFDVLNNKESLSVIKEMNEKQELGIFLEITPDLAKAAGVEYNDTGAWHYATSVFLSGYLQEERLQLIEVVFGRFKEVFGYYPKSVGSWWTDSYSLDYMQDKYGITANLGCADQFATDGYQIWGTPWSTPYYPNKFHAGVPANNEDIKLDLVTLQWASRDPINGYFSSLYSTQDYHISPVNQDLTYFEKLIDLYGRKHDNEFGQITIGLEGDLESGAYENQFKEQMELTARLRDSGDFKILTMSDFGNWYRNNFPEFSPTHIVETNDLLYEPIKVIWYQSPQYRVGIRYDLENKSTTIFDFRSYHSNFQEPYYLSPNRELNLSIYIPSYFDEINNKEDVWKLSFGELTESKRDGDSFELAFESGAKILLNSEEMVIEGVDMEIPRVLLESEALRVINRKGFVKIIPEEKWIAKKEGVIIRDLTDVATHHLLRKRILVSGVGVFAALIFGGYLIFLSNLPSNIKRVVILTAFILPTLYGARWYMNNLTNYYVSQAEMDALFRLSVLPEGKVLVYDKECFGCTWHTPEKPAVFANKRSYVKKYGLHPIVYNLSVFEAENQAKAKEEFDKLNVAYIYLVKYEDYIEKTPFSPGDLGIEKIYDNANAEIWRVKN